MFGFKLLTPGADFPRCLIVVVVILVAGRGLRILSRWSCPVRCFKRLTSSCYEGACPQVEVAEKGGPVEDNLHTQFTSTLPVQHGAHLGKLERPAAKTRDLAKHLGLRCVTLRVAALLIAAASFKSFTPISCLPLNASTHQERCIAVCSCFLTKSIDPLFQLMSNHLLFMSCVWL
eukprot:747226-Hanusia_phi.AAC.2